MTPEWYIARDGRCYGPFTQNQLCTYVDEGMCDARDLFWSASLPDWSPLELIRSNLLSSPRGPSALSKLTSDARRLLRAPLNLGATALQLVTSPSDFAARIDAGPRSLSKSIAFFVKLFAITFLIGSTLSFLEYFRGGSQARVLGFLALQLALGIPLIFFANRLFWRGPTFSGTAQSVFYVDAIFLFVQSLVDVAINAYFSSFNFQGGELDIITTEFLSCVRGKSILLQAVMDEYQVFENAHAWREFFSVHSQYATVVPFCVLFGLVMRARYGVWAWFNAAAAMATFVFVVWAAGWLLLSEIQRVSEDGRCVDDVGSIALLKYNRETVTRQLAKRIDAQLRPRFNASEPVVKSEGAVLVMDLGINGEPTKENVSVISVGARAFYCGDNTDFRLAKNANIPLRTIVRSDGGAVLDQQLFSSETCEVAN